jgi:hypothetical protein
MSDDNKYLMEVCELCQKPIGYASYVTDANGQQPLHAACLDEADLKATGFIPAGRIVRNHLRTMTADLIPPDEDDSKGHA